MDPQLRHMHRECKYNQGSYLGITKWQGRMEKPNLRKLLNYVDFDFRRLSLLSVFSVEY